MLLATVVNSIYSWIGVGSIFKNVSMGVLFRNTSILQIAEATNVLTPIRMVPGAAIVSGRASDFAELRGPSGGGMHLLRGPG